MRRIVDKPYVEGLVFKEPVPPSLVGREHIDEDLSPGYGSSESRDWTPTFLSRLWAPPKVTGEPSFYFDFPCLRLIIPAFSRHACDVLRDMLEQNGELLPLDSHLGEYYAYNVTKIADVLDVQNSEIDFRCDPPTTGDIDYFAFQEERLEGLSIFRIPEDPVLTIVTDEFVKRARSYDLCGFHFEKSWPLSPGTYPHQHSSLKLQEIGRLRQHSLLIILPLIHDAPDAIEKERIAAFERDVHSQLPVADLSNYFGYYAGHNIVNCQYRMFFACPNVDLTARHLLPVIKASRWSTSVRVTKRYGGMYDRDCREESIDLELHTGSTLDR